MAMDGAGERQVLTGRSAWIGLAGAFLFFSLRNWAIEGGDTLDVIRLDHGTMLWRNPWVWNERYPLSHFLVARMFHWTGDVVLSFQIVSSACGGVWLAILSLFSRSPRFWVVNLASVLPLVFLGHQEFYAPVAAALTLYFYLLTRVGHPGTRIQVWHGAVAWIAAVACHKLAFVYGPALVFLFLDRRGRWMRHPNHDAEKTLLALIAGGALMVVPHLLWIQDWGSVVVTQPVNPLAELLTLPEAWAVQVAARSQSGAYQCFFFGSWEHFRHFFGFVWMGAPLGWALLLWLRRRAFFPASVPLMVGAVCGLVWAFLWHPHMGWRDWDLFATAAIPVNLWAGLAVDSVVHRA